MSEDEQRIAIAEACGWTWTEDAVLSPDGVQDPRTNLVGYRAPLEEFFPDYLRDLNAMHEAEKLLNEWQQEQFGAKLYTGNPNTGAIRDFCTGRMVFRLAHTTSLQRAEAFLRTLGKWKETP